MASASAAGAIKHEAETRIIEVLGAHGRPGVAEDLAAVGGGSPEKDPWHHAAYQATMLAGLAEIIEDQGRRMTALEQAAAKPTAATKGGAKK